MRISLYLSLFICSFMIFLSCDRTKFYKFDRNDISFQILLNKGAILRAVNTEGEGARKLQLYSLHGKLIEELTIHNEPFEINRWQNDTIEIMFHIGDFLSFKPWFETNKYKQKKISNYNIIYTYTKILVINQSIHYNIDSFYINKDDHKVTLFLQKKIIKELLVDKLLVNFDRFTYEDFNNGIMSGEEYICQNRSIIEKYLKEILKLY